MDEHSVDGLKQTSLSLALSQPIDESAASHTSRGQRWHGSLPLDKLSDSITVVDPIIDLASVQ